jgi:hypothetical protein
MLIAPFFDLGLGDSSLEVRLVSQKHHYCLVGFVSTEVVPLFFYIFEGALTGHVEHHEYSMATFEVG